MSVTQRAVTAVAAKNKGQTTKSSSLSTVVSHIGVNAARTFHFFIVVKTQIILEVPSRTLLQLLPSTDTNVGVAFIHYWSYPVENLTPSRLSV